MQHAAVVVVVVVVMGIYKTECLGGSCAKDLMEGLAASFEAEFDYRKEAQLQLTCRKNLSAAAREYASIPEVHSSCTTIAGAI